MCVAQHANSERFLLQELLLAGDSKALSIHIYIYTVQ